MSKNSIYILLLSVLFVLTQGSQPQRFALNQGRVSVRNLAATTSAEKLTLDHYSDNNAVFVNLGEEYLTRSGLTIQNQTDMAIVLYSNVTAFCRDCTEFVHYNCNATINSCNADLTVKQSYLSPHFKFSSANPVNHSIAIGNTSNPSWKLSNNASLIGSYLTTTSISRPGYARDYFTSHRTYGILGLGVGGGAASNFRGDHPLFSVSMNSTGFGQLIFGKDTRFYDSSKTPVTLTTDTNWTMLTKNLTFGPNYSNTSFVSHLMFDLQHPGIAIPRRYWDDSRNPTNFFNILHKKYDLTSYGVAVDDYYTTYYGNLTDLPDLVFGLENGKNITIPPSGYTRKSTRANDTWVILIHSVESVTNTSDPERKEIDYTILGWSVLSQFYTVFEQKIDSEPTISLYTPKFPSGSDSSSEETPSTPSTPSSFGARVVQIGIIALILAVAFICCKRRAASKLQSDLGEQLNTSTNAF